MTDAPPKPSHAGPLLATALLTALWLFLTVGSGWLAPRVAAVAEIVEAQLGLDRSVGPRKPEPKEQGGDK